MAYLGRSYKFVKSENMDALLEHFGVSAEKIQAVAKSKPTQKLEKIGDDYVLTTIDDKTTELKFQEGVEFDEKLSESYAVKSTVTIAGDVITQIQKFGDGRVVTITKKYNGDDLAIELKSSSWDGVAYRYYSAA